MENYTNFVKKVNAPTMAYKTVYGKDPSVPIRGRSDGKKKMWKTLDVDYALKDRWLENLNKLPVEIRSTDAGKDKIRVAFVIFRLPKEFANMANDFVQAFKTDKHTFISSDIGKVGRARICVASDLVEGDSGWGEWWEILPKKILDAFNKFKKNK